jgi:hypothetical protein
LQLINEDFGRHAHDLAIFSFYETMKTNIGISSVLVVDKTSAKLGPPPATLHSLPLYYYWATNCGLMLIEPAGPGYMNERVQFMDANHRDICKYNNFDDPNYARMRNALASAIDDLSHSGTLSNATFGSHETNQAASFNN